MAGDKKLCAGCRDNFYNTRGNSTTGECWNLKTAQVVTRFRLSWWTQPDTKGAFQKVETNSCHYATGRYALYKTLPDFVTADERRRIDGGEVNP